MRSELEPGRVYRKSWNSTNKTGTSDDPNYKDKYVDFDPRKGQVFADAKRESHQFGKFKMKVSIPRYTSAYQVADRLRQIVGRDCWLAMGGGGDRGTPTFPKIVGITFDFARGEHTVLIVQDTAIAHRHRRMR
jgi:hypothetical protein